MKKILIIQTAFLGDTILATGLLEKLHQHYPQAKIDFLLRKGNEGIFHQHPFLNQIKIWHKKKLKYWNWFKLFIDIRKEEYDIVINIQRYIATGLWTAFSGAKHRIGFANNPLHFFFTHAPKHSVCNGKHEIEKNIELISHLTNSEVVKPKLYPSFNYWETLSLQKIAYVCIAPNSVWFTKQLPEKKWLECIENIPENYKIFLIGSPEDHQNCLNIKKNVKNPDRVFNLAGKLSLLESAALMAKAKMNFTNDSGPLHLASAMNAPISAVFCSTTLAYGFGPISENQRILETKEVLDCRPCGPHGWQKCPKKHFKCALTIDFKQLNEEKTLV